jgi:hypothetical protein
MCSVEKEGWTAIKIAFLRFQEIFIIYIYDVLTTLARIWASNYHDSIVKASDCTSNPASVI